MKKDFAGFDWPLIKARLKEAVLALPHFFRNPVQGMRQIPDWEWPELLILQAIFAGTCSILSNIVARSLWGVVSGVVIGPIINFLITGIATGFFFYVFMFIFKREIAFKRIYLQLLFASIPLMLTLIIVPAIGFAVLIGAAATGFLLFVGFKDSFYLDERKLRFMLGGLFGLFALFWIAQTIGSSNRHERMRERATPESIDILEKELNGK